jgi:hypothetical protein
MKLAWSWSTGVALAALAAGCSSGGGGGTYGALDGGRASGPAYPGSECASCGADAASPDGSTPSASGSASSKATDGPLRVVSVTPTVATLTLYPTPPTETTKTELVAIVTQQEGAERIAGGQLEDADGHVYGAFQTGANKGTLSLALDWMGINAVAPISLEKGKTKTFTARFFDDDGHEVSMDVDLAFQCRIVDGELTYTLPTTLPNGGVLTGTYQGRCFDDDHCGTSGAACTGGRSCAARTGECEPASIELGAGCVHRDDFPSMKAPPCHCGAPMCTPGTCTCGGT